MAPFFSINKAWGKFQERDASFSLVLNRKASLRMVCSAQNHLITILKQQIRGGEGEGSSATSSTAPQTKLRLSGHHRLATDSGTTQTFYCIASIYLFLFRIVRLLLMENVGSKMALAPVYLTARNYGIISCYCE